MWEEPSGKESENASEVEKQVQRWGDVSEAVAAEDIYDWGGGGGALNTK